MKILFIGDIFGRAGRRITKQLLPEIKEKENIDFVIANGENAFDRGFGITEEIVNELISYGIDCLTSGNHVWEEKKILEYLEKSEIPARQMAGGRNPKSEVVRLLRPFNYPPGVPGLGSYIYKIRNSEIGVINLLGRAFLVTIDCPFRTGMEEIKKMREKTKFVFVDFHAETTAEKQALAWYLDGYASCIVGTHTHVQTADERILPEGTGYISDVGMTGPFDSVIGARKDQSIKALLTGIPVKFEAAEEDVQLNAVVIELDEKTGFTKSIKRIQIKEN